MTKGRPASHAFVAKRGKLRRVQKKPVAKKTMDYKKIPYVRGGRDLPARGVRMERSSWKRSLPELLSASNAEIVAMLQQDGLLPEWRGKVCPHCWKGKLSSTTRYEMPHYRCTSNKCGKFVVPHYLHPLFQVSSGYTRKSLQLQAAILLLRLTGVKSAAARLLFRVNHKMYDDLGKRLERLRKCHVESKEKEITFGNCRTWTDVEVDEATFGRCSQPGKGKKCVLWEQWSGLLQRGKPKTLVLNKLKPMMTVKRAPGPGAIRKVDWKPLGMKHLQDRKIVLHSDSARSYKLKLSGVVHDAVVHCKKRVKVNGKYRWVKPKYTRVTCHKLPGGKKLKVKAGTQHIDRAWRFLKDRLPVNQSLLPGSCALRAKIRSAQYEYWHRGDDLWLGTGELVTEALRPYVQNNP